MSLVPRMSSAPVDLTNFAPRDFRGYGRSPPNPNWPNGAKIAVNFVINYEEGGEHTLDNGDAHAETMLQEVGPVRFPALPIGDNAHRIMFL